MPLEPEEHAWRVHMAMQEWIKHAETKASFLLTIQSGLLIFFSSRLFERELQLVDRLTAAPGSPFALVAFLIGLGCLLGSIGCLVMVVIPRLRARKLAAEKAGNAIYFGHVAGRDWQDVKDLIEGPTMLDQLSRQVAVTATIAWSKHIWLQTSMVVAVVGLVLISIAYVLTAFVVT
jgi:hypothetical protein